jgi:hypothetical protein
LKHGTATKSYGFEWKDPVIDIPVSFPQWELSKNAKHYRDVGLIVTCLDDAPDNPAQADEQRKYWEIYSHVKKAIAGR